MADRAAMRRSRNQREGWYYGRYSTLLKSTFGLLYRALDMGAPPEPRRHRRIHARSKSLRALQRGSYGEHAPFAAWMALPKSERLTGWLTWRASLAQRGVPAMDQQQSRPAFDRWLATVRATNWTLFDAWCAAAHWRGTVVR